MRRDLSKYITIGTFTGVLLAITGCETAADPDRWRHDSKPASEWGGDYSACAAYARREIWRDANVHAGSISEETRSQGLVGGFERTDARKRQAELISYCMTRLGYRLSD